MENSDLKVFVSVSYIIPIVHSLLSIATREVRGRSFLEEEGIFYFGWQGGSRATFQLILRVCLSVIGVLWAFVLQHSLGCPTTSSATPPVAAQKIRPHYDKLTHPRRDLWSTAWKNHHGRPGYAVLRS